jgi:genome maintenance exonuclease 1
MQLINIRKRYVYKKLERLDRSTGRVYQIDTDSIPMPSVTTILDQTKDKAHLKDWEDRVGKQEAERVRNEAATVGTHMHSVIERLLLNRPLDPPRTWMQIQGYRMGHQLLEHFFPHVDEVWGTEIPLYVPNTYAGTSDCIGVYKGKPSIMDFKQTNKPKRREWIEDYCLQLAGYSMAHNTVHGTDIQKGVIMMVTPDNYYQEFIIEGQELKKYMHEFLRRVNQYYNEKK